jgi:hypothetical protein
MANCGGLNSILFFRRLNVHTQTCRKAAKTTPEERMQAKTKGIGDSIAVDA